MKVQYASNSKRHFEFVHSHCVLFKPNVKHDRETGFMKYRVASTTGAFLRVSVYTLPVLIYGLAVPCVSPSST
jgi:hypothetical protein